jgi:hypothetical protein
MLVMTTLPFHKAEAPDPKLQRRPRAAAVKTAGEAHVVNNQDRMPPETLPVATIFHEPWWLSAASDNTYEEAVVTIDNTIVGRLPYLRQRKTCWQTALVMPAMTHLLGPSLSRDLAKGDSSRSLRRFTICGDLIRQLPQAGHIWFTLHRRETDVLAFEAAGFSTGAGFTVEIKPNTPEVLWRQMRDKTRNVIRRAQESLTAQAIDDPTLFLDFYEENLRQRGRRNRYDRRICANLMAACLARGRGRLLFAIDAAGNPRAAIFTIWDHETEYYLMSTRAPDSGNGATSLLIWTALQEAASEGRVFDMDGLDSQTNHLLVTGFGGSLQPRYMVSQTSRSFQIGRSLKTGLETVLGMQH